eukprot:scaffold3967_cov126-Skeletonema_dohrnii-CCMP3373.AAC.10
MTITVTPPTEDKENSGIPIQELSADWPPSSGGNGNAVFCAEVAPTKIVIPPRPPIVHAPTNKTSSSDDDDDYGREEVSAVLLDMVTTVELFGDQRKGTSFVREERPNKKKKLCSSAGCKNLARPGKVVCVKHGAKDYRKLCSALDCTSYAQKGGLCYRHVREIFGRVPAPKRKREASDGDDEEEEAYPKKAARILGESSGSNASWPLTNILTPGSNDCLFGSGGVTNKHPGNRKYRHLVTLKEETYRNANRLGGKGVVAMEVVDVWRNMDPPGRFLQQDKDSMLWSDVGDAKAKKKVTTAFIYRMRGESVTKASKGASVSGSKMSSEKYVPSPPSYPPPGYFLQREWRKASSTTEEMQSVLI